MNPVRVSIPASVAGNIKSLKKSMAEILGMLGCPACCSGHDIYLELQRSITLRKGLKDEVIAGTFSRDTIKAGFGRSVSVGIKPDQVNTLDDVFTAIDRIAEISGHSACATGCDLFFNLERNFVINPRLQVIEETLVMR